MDVAATWDNRTASDPPRGSHSSTTMFDLNTCWDSRGMASAPEFFYEAGDDLSSFASPIFDWTRSPTQTVDYSSNDPVCSQPFLTLMTQDVEPELEVLTQLPTPGSGIKGSGSKGAKKKGNNYNHDEDIQLCDSWMNISQDPIVGTDQSSKSYWQRIADDFNAHMKGITYERSASSVEHRWGVIRVECMKFHGYFESVERRHRSGVPFNEYVVEAQALYASNEEKNKAFPFLHCWMMVRHSEKFLSLHEDMKKSKNKKSGGGQGGEEEGQDPITDLSAPPAKRYRPPGQKQSKEKLKRHEGSDELQVWSSFLELKNEEKKDREERWKQSNLFEQRKLEIEERGLQRKLEIKERRLQWEQENKIMFCDVSTMDENQKAYVLAMRAEIARDKVATVNAKLAADGATSSNASDDIDFSSV